MGVILPSVASRKVARCGKANEITKLPTYPLAACLLAPFVVGHSSFVLFWGALVKSKKSGVKTTVAQFVAIIALSISVFLVIDLGRRAAANYRVHREAERLSREVELARQEQVILKEQLAYVQSDLYIEEVARRDLKWARPGETVMVVMPTPEAVLMQPQAEINPINAPPVAQTPAQAWWYVFFGTNVYPRYLQGEP